MLWNMKQAGVGLSWALLLVTFCTPLRGQVLPGPGAKARDLFNPPTGPAGRSAALRAADFGIWFRAQSGSGRGSLVADVAVGSVFARAGIREGDSIISINGEAVKTETRLVQLLTAPAPAGQPFNIIFVRDGQERSVTLLPSAVIESVAVVDPLYQLGMILDQRDPTRLVIERVYPRTPAYYAGLRAGDVITSLNNIALRSLDTLTRAIAAGPGELNLVITRNGEPRPAVLVIDDDVARTALRPALPAAVPVPAPTVPALVPAAPAITPAAPAVVPVAPVAPAVVPAAPVPRAVVPTAPAPPVIVPAAPAAPSLPEVPPAFRGS